MNYLFAIFAALNQCENFYLELEKQWIITRWKIYELLEELNGHISNVSELEAKISQYAGENHFGLFLQHRIRAE